MTQRELGLKAGFGERSADIRIAQYESDVRTLKKDILENIAHALEVSPMALDVPEIDNYYGLLHTLFTIEDRYGLNITKADGQPAITLDIDSPAFSTMFNMLSLWGEESDKLKDGVITKEDYDDWRYNYPEREAERQKEERRKLKRERG